MCMIDGGRKTEELRWLNFEINGTEQICQWEDWEEGMALFELALDGKQCFHREPTVASTSQIN